MVEVKSRQVSVALVPATIASARPAMTIPHAAAGSAHRRLVRGRPWLRNQRSRPQRQSGQKRAFTRQQLCQLLPLRSHLLRDIREDTTSYRRPPSVTHPNPPPSHSSQYIHIYHDGPSTHSPSHPPLLTPLPHRQPSSTSNPYSS